MGGKRGKAVAWMLESSRFTGILVVVDAFLSLPYSYLTGTSFMRVLAGIMILEGAIIMMASTFTMSKGLRREYTRTGGTDDTTADELPSEPAPRVPRGTPLMLSALTLIIIGFFVDLVGFHLIVYFKNL